MLELIIITSSQYSWSKRWDEGGQARRQDMSGVRKALFLVVLLALIPPADAVRINPESWNNSAVVEGGFTILVEEYTATWCEQCAQIDEDLEIITDDHGSRISMISYHPSDGVDAFEPPAAEHRLERLRLQHPNLAGSPSFVVHNGLVREGVESWPDVQSDILKEESSQRGFTELKVTAETNETELMVTVFPPLFGDVQNDTQVSILFLQHNKVIPDGFINPGTGSRDRVLVGLAEFPMNGNPVSIDTTIVAPFVASYPIDSMEQWSVVVVHEYTSEALTNKTTTDSKPLGVVEISIKDPHQDESTELPLLLPIIIFMAIGALGIISSKNKKKVKEEE